MPRIKSRFARIEPSNEAWTIRISFCRSQWDSPRLHCGTDLLESNAIQLKEVKGEHRSCKSRTTSMGSREQREGTDDMGRD